MSPIGMYHSTVRSVQAVFSLLGTAETDAHLAQAVASPRVLAVVRIHTW